MTKVVVIGIDGATLELMEPWMNAGKLPYFDTIRKRGAWGKLASTIPPFSAPAWTSIITGCKPGKHGIYGFERTDTLESHIITSRFRKVPALWNFLTDVGKKSIIINVPGTFPPEAINGVMITGLLTPSPESNFTYPSSIKQRLTAEDLGMFAFEQLWIEDFPRSFLAKHAPEKLLTHINNEMISHATVTLNLMKESDWDFTMVVFRGTDTAQHYLFHRQDLLLMCYQKVEQLVSEIIANFPDAVFFVVSDHGFELIKKILYPDNVLYNAGFLTPMRPLIRNPRSVFMYFIDRIGSFILRCLPPKIAKQSQFIRKLLFSGSSKQKLIDFSKTKAFCTADGRGIQINQKQKYDQGIIDKKEYEILLKEIQTLFTDLRDSNNNEPIVEKVYRWDEAYGTHAIFPPDLVLQLKKGITSAELIRISYPLSRKSLSKGSKVPYLLDEDSAGRTGDHAPYGVFFAYGKIIKEGYEISDASVIDILPMVFASFGLSSPPGIDGRLQEAIFKEKPTITPVDWTLSVTKSMLSAAELKKIQKLKKMFTS